MGHKHNDKCLRKAGDNEMLFVLRSQDVSAPKIVIEWIRVNFESAKDEKLREAFECALEMRRFGRRKIAD